MNEKRAGLTLRRLIPVIALTAIFLAVAPGAHANGRAAGCYTTASSCRDNLRPARLAYIHMVTPSVGWGLSAHWVLRTSDGGLSWPPFLHVASGTWVLATADGSTDAWVAAVVPAIAGRSREVISVHATSNSGVHWRRFGPFVLAGAMQGGSVAMLQFLNSRLGWMEITGSPAAGSVGHELLRTHDGGKHWNRIEYNYLSTESRHALPGCNFVAQMSFATRNNGWATGICGGLPSSRHVYRTTNGGRTWFPKKLILAGRTRCPTSAPCSATFESMPPTFSGGNGILPVSAFPPPQFVLFHTSDGGKIWNSLTPIKGNSNQMGPRVTTFGLDSNHLWVLIHGDLFWTGNGGASWVKLAHRPGLGANPQIQFVSPTDGFAVKFGHPDAIWTSSDAGRTWQKRNTVL